MTEMQPYTGDEQRLIVEVGAGRYDPMDKWRPLPATRIFQPNEVYLGLDIGERSLRPDALPGPNTADEDQRMRLGWAALQSSRPDEALYFAQADGCRLPLPDESVDQFIGVNMLGRGVKGEEALATVLREAHRVLKLEGEIVLHDFVTPRFTNRVSIGAWFDRQQNAPNLTMRPITPDMSRDRYGTAMREYGLRDTRGEYCTSAEDAIVWIMQKPERWPYPFPRRPLQ